MCVSGLGVMWFDGHHWQLWHCGEHQSKMEASDYIVSTRLLKEKNVLKMDVCWTMAPRHNCVLLPYI